MGWYLPALPYDINIDQVTTPIPLVLCINPLKSRAIVNVISLLYRLSDCHFDL